MRDLKGWAELAPHLFIWDYIVDYAQYIAPWPNFQVLGPNIKVFGDNSHVRKPQIDGVLLTCGAVAQGRLSGRCYAKPERMWPSGILSETRS